MDLFDEEEMDKKLKTPLRYPGGKSKATNKLLPYFPDLSKCEEYREPFLGGGSVAIAVTRKNSDMSVWVNDLYWPLYNFWTQLQSNGELLSKELRESKLNSNEPVKARELFNLSKEILNSANETPFNKAKAFWVVNKCSFSGLTESSTFSEQSSIVNFTLNGIDNLSEYSSFIKHWKITNLSYEQLLTDSGNNTFTYLDPPYEISSNLYGKKGSMHRGFDHDLFAKRCNESNLAKIAISYNADQSVKDRFPHWTQNEFPLTYSMNNQSKNYRNQQKDRNELLLTNY